MQRILLIMTAGVMLFGLTTVVYADDAQYIGSGKCFMCHKKDKSGNQMQKWLDGEHAGAYKTLANEESLAIAKELGIADPQKADECLKCHVTAHGVAAEGFAAKNKYTVEDGVGCESCHGPGSTYKSAKVMKAVVSGETDGASVGLWAPNAELCVTCHNEESPTFKGFEFDEYIVKVSHPIPEAHMAKYKEAKE